MNLQPYLLSLFSAMHLAKGSGTAIVPETQVSAFTSEIGAFGYTFDGAMVSALKTLSRADFTDFRHDTLRVLGELTGVGNSHRVLFNKFPYDTPKTADYLFKRLIGYLQAEMGDDFLGADNYQRLSCGHVIDPNLFNTEDFGACPICQQQVPELNSPDVAKFSFKSVTPMKVIMLATDLFVAQKASGLLVRNSSLSPQEREFINLSADRFNLARPVKVFRETLPLVYTIFDGKVDDLLSGATDVLRIATYLSQAHADLSLKDNTKFKLRTSDKKKLIKFLNSLHGVNLEEDLMRHREKWLRLGEYLNPGSKKNAARWPKVALAFGKLRNNPNKIETFNRAHGYVDAKSDRLAMLCRGVMELPARKPTVFDVVSLNAKARGRLVASMSNAEHTFTLENVKMEDIMAMTADD